MRPALRDDARIPVCFVGATPQHPPAGQALLLAHSAEEQPSGWVAVLRLPRAPGHAAGCPCCFARPAQAVMLTRLLRSRACGEIGFFQGIVASLPQAEADGLRALLRCDPMLSATFKDEAGAFKDKEGHNPWPCTKD